MPNSFFANLNRKLFEPVSIYPIVYFRIAFGLTILAVIYKYTHTDLLKTQFTDQLFHFTFWGFSWVRPLPIQEMHFIVLGMGVCALFLTLGFIYRISTALLFLGLSYFFLLEKSYYLNHFYLILLINFLLIFVPANRNFSLDSYFRITSSVNQVSAWCLWIFRVQVLIVYFYAGIAKLNFDWLQGHPMLIWLYLNKNLPVIGSYLADIRTAYFFSYSGLIIDLLIAPLLIFRPTRIFAIIVIVSFHLLNSVLFKIGVFPWLMIITTLLFLDPKFFNFIDRLKISGTAAFPEFDRSQYISPLMKKFTVIFLALYFLIQIILPLRHHFYPGNVNWTEVGHEFSWRMMLRQKFSKSDIYVYDNGSRKRFEVVQNKFLSRLQMELIAADPEMMLQFVEFLKGQLALEGYDISEITAVSMVSLNGRKHQLMFDPSINLLEKNRVSTDYSWVNSVENPLPKTLDEVISNINLQKYQKR